MSIILNIKIADEVTLEKVTRVSKYLMFLYKNNIYNIVLFLTNN